jgi:predicted PurR-regulated permease PerM
MSNGQQKEPSFQRKVWITTGIVILAVVLIWLIKAIFSVLLLILAASLVALYFRGLSGLLVRKLHFTSKLALPVSIIGSLLLLGLFFWLAGSRINEQVQQLSATLPGTIEKAKQQIGQSAIGQKALEQFGSSESMKKSSETVRQFFRSSFGVLADVYVILFLGLFFTVSPRVYVNGFLKLIPLKGREKAEEVVNQTGSTLTKWLKGKLFAMLVVAVLTIIGLLIIGVPMAFTLGLIAGILNFIPNFGPLIAMIPAGLVGLMQSPTIALLVAGLYIVVQVVESNIITPQIQKRLIEIPPGLIIIAQLLMGVLTGGWGLLLATPLIAILMVTLNVVWISKNKP